MSITWFSQWLVGASEEIVHESEHNTHCVKFRTQKRFELNFLTNTKTLVW